MEMVRFAIIGCGSIAEKHALAIRQTPKAQLAACYSKTQANAERFAHAWGIHAYESYDALLTAESIDAVSICTPSGLHTTQAVAAIRQGKHVLIEKPMSLTLEEADSLIDISNHSHVKVGVISQYRFAPAVIETGRAIKAGALGRITSGSLQMKYCRSPAYYDSADWRGTWSMDGGGALMNQGIHGVDIFRFLMGTPKTLTACARTQVHAIEVEDSAVAILEFENGALGTIEGSTACYPGYPRRVEICGSKGSVILEEDAIIRWDVDIPCLLPVGLPARNVASSNPGAISLEGHARHYDNFVNAVLHDEPLLEDTAAGRLPLEIILAIYQSSMKGKSVDMAAFQRAGPSAKAHID